MEVGRATKLVKSKNENNQTEGVPSVEGKATVVAHPAKMQVSYFAVESRYLGEYIGAEMRKTYDCSIAKIGSDYYKMT